MKRRPITHAAAAQQMLGSARIAPGLWVDRHGDIHVSVPELLRLVGLADTDENRERVAAMVDDVLRQHRHATVIRQDLIPDA